MEPASRRTRAHYILVRENGSCVPARL